MADDALSTRPTISPITCIIGENGSRLDRVGTVTVLAVMLYFFMGDFREQNAALGHSIDALKASVMNMDATLKELLRK